jgi:ribosomal protein S18 acetylase RimI-like enzyme
MTLIIAPTLDMAVARELINEYGVSTGLDLEFQGFSHELATLPGQYDPILVAIWNGEPAGCVALRRLDAETCEMKRLYVRPRHRALKAGRALALQIIEEARKRRFKRMRLDTLPTMGAAMGLYESLGFKDIAPYRYNPVAGTRYMELEL